MSVRDALGRFASDVWDSSVDTDSMEWSVVSSSNVAAVGYNPGRSILGVSFLNGSTYNYFDVDPDTFEMLRSAGSVGKFLAYVIKGHYAYERVS